MPQRASDESNGSSLLGITERISRNESGVSELDRRVSNLEDRSDTLARLSVSFEYLTETNKEQNLRLSELAVLQAKQAERIGETLSSIDRQLSVLDTDQKQVQKEAQEDRVRIKALEEDSKGKDKNVIKRVVDFVVALVLAYVALKLGLK